MSNMEFDHKPFPESSFESAFTYMDSGLDYFQYPPSPIGVNVGCEYSNPGICNHYQILRFPSSQSSSSMIVSDTPYL